MTTVFQSADLKREEDTKLAELGYKPELRRQYSALATAALAVITCNSWGAVGGSLITGIAYGGSPTLIFGWILIAIINVFLALSLGELASAYPTSAGAYYWVAALSPKQLVAPLSYVTGLLNIIAWIVTTCGAGFFQAQCVLALANLCNPEFVIERWMTYLIYLFFLAFAYTMATVGDRLMPLVVRWGLYWTTAACFVSSAVVLAKSSPKATAKQVFATFTNQSGWSSNGIAACIGLINPAFGYAGFDAAIHYAEEVRNPSKALPRALLALVVVNFVTALFFLISLSFSVTDYSAAFTTPTGIPLSEMYRQAGGTGAAIGLTFIVFIAGLTTFCDCFIATARLNWSLARDNAFPFSSTMAKIHPKLGIPLWSATVIVVIEALLGIIYVFNTTAFNAFISSSIVINNLVYMLPVVVNMARGRRALRPGTFRLKGIWGWICNGIMCSWVVFTAIFFELPFVRPVTAANMNYTVVIMMSGVILGSGWYLLRGHRRYTGPVVHVTMEGINQLGLSTSKEETHVVQIAAKR